MTDTRENILVRLGEIAATIPNVRSVHRNNVDLTEDQFPAVIIFDGDENTDDADDASMRPPYRPTIVTMTPQIVIAQQTDAVGSEVNDMRRELLKRVLTDTELNEQIVKTGRNGNGAIRYLGCESNMGWMRTLYGALLAHFLFKYSLKPDDL